MKYILSLFFCLILYLVNVQAQVHKRHIEKQGTTVKMRGCDVWVIIQIALNNDSTGDVEMIQSALDDCFSLVCDLPCADGTIGKCKVFTRAVVVSSSSLNAADKAKFHQVEMASGEGISHVDAVGVPNSGKSTGGKWYRVEYSPKVYCHEVMHLAGLDDHYRDCRPERLALGVDNCKDGDTCTAAQIARGACPPCKGYENDIMGNDVTKPVTCNMDVVEILRIANDPLNPQFICPDSCCEKPKTNIVFVDGGLIREDSHPKFNLYGGSIGYTYMLNNNWGATIEGGIYFGSNNNVDYRKIVVLGGAVFFPGNKPFEAHKIKPQLQLLAGITNIHSDFGNFGSFNNNSFTIAPGAGINYMLSNRLGLNVKVDDLITTKGGTSHNIRISAGLVLGSGRK